MSENEIKLEVSIGAGDIVHLTIGGNITAREMPQLMDWINKTKDTIKKLYEKKNEKVLCLVEIIELKEYHPEVLTELAKLMKENEPYVLRTATFGGNAYLTMAEDIIVALSGRKNLHSFKSRGDAVTWLRGGGEDEDKAIQT